MKKFNFMLVMVLTICFTTTGFSWGGNKYDVVLKNKSVINQINTTYENAIGSSSLMAKYFNAIINRNDLLRMVRNKEFNVETSTFISQNVDLVTKFVHLKIAQELITLKPTPTDRELSYVTAVLTDKKRMSGAKNGVEENLAEDFFENYRTYKFAKLFKADLKTLTNQCLEVLIEISKK